MENPLVNDRFLLKKMEMKGGWTYAEIPGAAAHKKGAFGIVRVRGTIDGYEIRQANIWSMANGNLFLPVKLEIRKAIRKQAGDWVDVVLFADDTPYIVPDEFLVCLLDAPNAHAFFETLNDSNKAYFTNWVFAAKRMETRIDRIAKSIERLEQGMKFYDPKGEI